MNDEPIPGSHEPGWVEPRIVEQRVPDAVAATMRGARGLRLFFMGDVRVLICRAPTVDLGNGPIYLWSASLSCADRHPTWDEIKTVRYRLLPLDINVAMHMPPPQWYVNQHEHVFQLWEDGCPWQAWAHHDAP